ncbi:hypothetical protein IWQ56_007483, partial [Coemansia nantahalensis]
FTIRGKPWPFVAVVEFVLTAGRTQGVNKNVRAAIGSVWRVLHPDKAALSECRELSLALKGQARRAALAAPVPDEPPIWPVETMLQLFRSKPANDALSLQELGAKMAMLLALATMWRPKCEIATLRRCDVRLAGQILTVRCAVPKCGRPRCAKLRELPDDEK